MTTVAMVLPVSIIVTDVVMAVWADVNLFCGCDSLWSGQSGNSSRGVANMSVSYCLGKGPGQSQGTEKGDLKKK